MRRLYILPLLLLLALRSIGQSCSLTASYETAESRCVSTGSITLTVTGGSGNYTYKVTAGPVTPPATSSNIITGLPTGTYSVQIKDLNSGCTQQIDNIFVAGSYSDPRFQLTKTDAGCAGNDGTISTINVENGRSPFTYTIIDPSPSNVGASNTTGFFAGLMPGEYSIQLQDSCGGIQVRRITIESYEWWFDNPTVSKLGCDSAEVSVTLKDNKGNDNTSGTAFNGYTYGAISPLGDTVWYTGRNFHAYIAKQRKLVLVVKDNCGQIHSTTWNFPDSQKPAISGVSTSNYACGTFTATVIGAQNLTNPTYTLYDNGSTSKTNSTGVFTGVKYGSYCIDVKDVCYDTTITTCINITRPEPSIGDIVISNQDCDGFTATVTGQSNLINPSYNLYDANDEYIDGNTSGVFTSLPYGSYTIRITDACLGTMIIKNFTVTKPAPAITSVSISGGTCTTFNVSATGTNLIAPNYCLYDQAGNLITCSATGEFDDVPYGDYCIKVTSCGQTSEPYCFTGSRPRPDVGSVLMNNAVCSGFDARVTGQVNLTNPQYCLYDSNNVLDSCNTTGIFNNIPYGSYTVTIHDGCTDTTIVRTFSKSRAIPSLNTTMQASSQTCSTLTVRVMGNNLTSPQYTLYDENNNVVGTNTSGIFNNIPYGYYCAEVHDGCVDTTMRVCQNFTLPRGFTLSTSKPCIIGKAYVDVKFNNSNSPFTIEVYHPNGNMILDTVTSINPLRLTLSALPSGLQYKIAGIDHCGQSDTAYITPDATVVTTSTTVRGKCPSATYNNGSGDINASSTSTLNSMLPTIIKKNGASFSKSYSSVNSGVYTFADLEPADYIVQYTMQGGCSAVVYDTVTVPPYAYPTQGQSAIYQCDNSSLSVGADVKGGVSPYSFQIIGSTPDSPSIISEKQVSPVFNINNGTSYSLVRLRAIDACGNATLSDVSVLPLQNIAISATSTCFYQNITLSVDTIPNASYQWYRKTSETDSTLVTSDVAYNIPFFMPDQVGQYVCKVNVNNGCITKLSYFDLNGTCGTVPLTNRLVLKGKSIATGNQLYWTSLSDKDVVSYVIERAAQKDGYYQTIGSLPVNANGYYIFNDPIVDGRTHYYRLKIVYTNSAEYSNVVSLQQAKSSISVYPNPAKDAVHISINTERPSDFRIEVVSANGQTLYKNDIKNTGSTVVRYNRNPSVPSGVYLIKITDLVTGASEVRKILFQ